MKQSGRRRNPNNTTTNLPMKILEEIGIQSGGQSGQKQSGQRHLNSRKELRKLGKRNLLKKRPFLGNREKSNQMKIFDENTTVAATTTAVVATTATTATAAARTSTLKKPVKKKDRTMLDSTSVTIDPLDAMEEYYYKKIMSNKNYKNMLKDDGLLDLITPKYSTSLENESNYSGSAESDHDTLDESNEGQSDMNSDSEQEEDGAVTDQESIEESNDKERNVTTSEQVVTSPQTTYIPPHLRQKDTPDNNLSKTIKGLLNRLSIPNLASITSSITDLVTHHPRKKVIVALSEALMTVSADPALQRDEFSSVHAGLIKCVSEGIGLEFSAFFVTELVQIFVRRPIDDAEEGDVKGKVETNVAGWIGYLYIFSVVSSLLVFDIIRIALERLDESDVEVLLKILRVAGSKLRTDDPTALGDIVSTMQSKLDDFKSKGIQKSTRFRFMVETILDLKNNKKKASKHTQSLQIINVTKCIKACGSRLEPLNVSLQDLQDKDKKGVWWLVGGAFKGSEKTELPTTKTTTSSIIRLAKINHMNTATRKEIFGIIMTSSDYLQARTSLLKLSLKGTVARDITRVIVYCLTQENVFNPYYTYLLIAWCVNVSEKVTLLYTVWDLLKQAHDKSVECMHNLAKTCVELCRRGILGIDILRPLVEIDVTIQHRVFIDTFFINALRYTDDVFGKISLKNSDIAAWSIVYLKSIFREYVSRLGLGDGGREVMEGVERVKMIMKESML